MNLDLIWKIAALIFSAGIFVAAVRQIRKDLNGVSTRERRETEIANYRFLTHVIADLVFENDPQKRETKGMLHLKAGFPEGRR